MKIVMLTMVSLKIAKSVSMPKEVMAHAMVILVDLLLLMEFMLADEYMPLMESIYCNVIYTGKMGTALIPKVLSNMLTCVHNQAMGEVFMIGKRAGVDM